MGVCDTIHIECVITHALNGYVRIEVVSSTLILFYVLCAMSSLTALVRYTPQTLSTSANCLKLTSTNFSPIADEENLYRLRQGSNTHRTQILSKSIGDIMSPKNKDGPSSGPEEIHLSGIVQPGPLPSNIDPDMNYVGLSSGWKSVMELTEDDEREDPNKVILVKLGSELLEMEKENT